MSDKRKNRIKLEDIPVKNNFHVPEGYFENFEHRILEQIKTPEKGNQNSKKSSWQLIRPQLMLAATIISFAVISFSIIYFVTKNNQSKDSINLAAFEYIENNIYNTHEDELINIYESLADPSESENVDEYTQAMIDYLVIEDIDIELIYNEL